MTRDEIFAAMAAAYTGGTSTREGTLAGDLLRAGADGCAQLWSEEVDGLEERAFVASAAGEDLTRVCADRGVARREGESDEALRERAMAALSRRGASGNADDYAAWCARVEGILRVRVLPCARGAGTVDVVAVGKDGRAACAADVAAAEEIVQAERPVGADARVYAAEETAVALAASVTLAPGAALETVQDGAAAALAALCREGALVTRSVSYPRVGALLLALPGVADVEALTLNGAAKSVALGERAVGVCGAVTLTEGGV